MNPPNKTSANRCCCPEIPKERVRLEEPEHDNGVWMPIDGKREMAHRYLGVRVVKPDEGIRRQKMKEKFWNEMLQKALDEHVTPAEPNNYCTEYNSNFYKDNFEPRKLEVMDDTNVRLKYPLYGTGSSAITYYSEKIEKRGPNNKHTTCIWNTSLIQQVWHGNKTIVRGNSLLYNFESVWFYLESDQGVNILEKFRKSQYYTKPMEERMDDGWVL